MEHILKHSELELWAKYLEQQLLGLKKLANELLRQFIEKALQYSNQEVDQIVRSLCELRSTGKFKINHILFTKLIYLNLIEKSIEKTPDYHRLLVTFEHSIYSDNHLNKEISKQLNLKENYFDSIEVLELELQINTNVEAAKLLIHKLAQKLDYALHELPIGLLYEIAVMENLLNRMVQLLEEYDLINDKWNNRIEFIKSAIKEWALYLAETDFSNFEEYLNKTKSKASELILNWNNSLLYDHEE